LPTSVIIDLAIAAVFVLCVVLGAKRGLFRSFAELVIVILALFLAARAAAAVSDFVVERVLHPIASSVAERRIDALLKENEAPKLPLDSLGELVDAIPNDNIRREAEKILGSLELPGEFSGGDLAREALTTAADQLLDALLGGMVRSLLYTVVFFLSALAVTVALRLLVRMLDLPFQLPVLREINGFGGLLFGGAKGVLLLWLGIWFLLRTGILLTPEMVEDTVLLRFAAGAFALVGHPVL